MPLSLTSSLTPLILAIVSACALILGLLAFILAILSARRTRSLLNRYATLVNGQEGADLERLINQSHRQVHEFTLQLQDVHRTLADHEDRLRKKAVRPVVLRYNAFGELGNDLSFAVSVVDENGDGAVMSSIFGREESRVYAKPLQNGTSTYTLTDEERRAVQLARQQNSPST
jgi:hypothetical protein